MRKVYRNPKELATCLKDLVDLYLEDVMTYDKLKEKIVAIVDANKDRFYKNGNVEAKVATMIGDRNLKVICEIVAE